MITTSFQYNDGGRIDSGFTTEYLDCTVRAYALVMNITYKESHKVFEQFGRKPRHTIKFSMFMQKKRPDICHFIPIRPRPRIRTFLKKTVLKNVIVRISGHCFCIKNNIILDTSNNENSIITDIWYFD